MARICRIAKLLLVPLVSIIVATGKISIFKVFGLYLAALIKGWKYIFWSSAFSVKKIHTYIYYLQRSDFS